MGRLVEHHGPRFAGQLLQRGAALALAGGQEALEGETPGVQTRYGQRGDGGAAAGYGLHRHAVFGAQRHQLLPGIADSRRTGVRYQRAGLACQQPGQNGLSRRRPVVLVIADQRLFDVEVIQQLDGHAGVLGGDKVRLRQRLHGAGGEVPQIADGRGDQIQHTSHCITPYL